MDATGGGIGGEDRLHSYKVDVTEDYLNNYRYAFGDAYVKTITLSWSIIIDSVRKIAVMTGVIVQVTFINKLEILC